MGEIAQSLKSFKTSVQPKLDSMTSFCNDIKSKVEEASEGVSSSKSLLEKNYKSENMHIISRRFERIGEIYSRISSSISGDLMNMVSQSKSLVSLIVELEQINTFIAEQQSVINKNANNEQAINLVNNARSLINSKNAQFNNIHEKALKKLEALKSMDAELTFTKDFSPNNNTFDPDDLQYGTFELKSFKASNGEVVDYYIYVPDYGKDVENLPAMLYMHGGSTHQNISSSSAIKYGLSSLIANKKITPSGIVIIPVMRNFDENGIKAVKEMTDNVVELYNVDRDKISVSGHSYGGITAYKLINRYPDYFSCCVPISGSEKVTSAFNGVPVWSFNGSYETGSSYTSIYSGQRATKEVNQNGGEGYMTTIKTGHAGTNKETYAHEYKSPDGEMINPLDWAFKQTKA